MKRIKLDDQYILIYSDIKNWDICRKDGSLVNKSNLPAYVMALVRYIIAGSHL